MHCPFERIVREHDMPRKPAKVGFAKITKLRQLWADGVGPNDIANALFPPDGAPFFCASHLIHKN